MSQSAHMLYSQLVFDNEGDPFAGITHDHAVAPEEQDRAESVPFGSVLPVEVPAKQKPALSAPSFTYLIPNFLINNSYCFPDSHNTFQWAEFVLSLAFTVSLVYILPANSHSFYYSRQYYPVVVSFFLVTLVWFCIGLCRRTELSLLKRCFRSFEMCFLSICYVTFIIGSIFQVRPEYDTAASLLQSSFGFFFFARTLSFFFSVLAFLAPMCCDALVGVSALFKIWLHVGFILYSVFNLSGYRTLTPEVGVSFCVGSTSLSCISSISVRFYCLFMIGLFFVRNVINLLYAHWGNLTSPDQQHLLIVRSRLALRFNIDEDRQQQLHGPLFFEPGTPIFELAQRIEQTHVPVRVVKVPAVDSVASVPALNSVVEVPQSESIVVAADLPNQVQQQLDAPPLPIAASVALNVEAEPVPPQPQPLNSQLPPPQPLNQSEVRLDAAVQLTSLFLSDFDFTLQPQRMLLGHRMKKMWNQPLVNVVWALATFGSICLNILLEPKNLTTFIIMIILLINCFVWTMSLIDLRLLGCLATTFEFWLLNVCSVAYCAIDSYVYITLYREAAQYLDIPPTIFLCGTLTWFLTTLLCNFIAISIDSLHATRRFKLMLCAAWTAYQCMIQFWLVFMVDSRPWVQHLSFCFSSTNCVVLQAFRIQFVFTMLIHLTKFSISLFRCPTALVTLRSTVRLN